MLEIVDWEVIIESYGVIIEVYAAITRINYVASDAQARCKIYGSQYLRVQYNSCSTTKPICRTIGGNLVAFAVCMLHLCKMTLMQVWVFDSCSNMFSHICQIGHQSRTKNWIFYFEGKHEQDRP